MNGRSLFASLLMPFSMAVGVSGIAPPINAAPLAQPFLNAGEGVKTNVIDITHRSRRPKIHLPLGPAYIYYDYPYYYGRGYYPTHIGGYVYYPYQYSRYPYYSRGRHLRYASRCAKSQRRCTANWRFGKRAKARGMF